MNKDSSLPIVNTIIVSYNHKDYLPSAIDSVLQQKGPFIHKILISDDGSSDDTRSIIKKYRNEYPDLISDISSQDNYGISSNYRHCIDNLDGDYAFFLEGDDYWKSPFKIIKIIEFFIRNPDISMCFNEMDRDDHGSIIPGELTGKISKNILYTSDFFDYQLNPILNLSCCAFRCKNLKKIPSILFEKQFSEISLGLYFAGKGGVGHIRDVLNIYRIHENGYWNGLSENEKFINYYYTRHDALAIIEKKYKGRLKRYLYTNFYDNPKFMECLADAEMIPDINDYINKEVGFLNLIVLKTYMLSKGFLRSL